MDPALDTGPSPITGDYLEASDLRALDIISWDFDSEEQPPQPLTRDPADPADDETGVDTEPTLSWNEGGFTDYVNVFVFRGTTTTSNFQVFEAKALEVESVAVPAGVLIPGTEYSWMVTGINAWGFTFSDVFSFTTAGCAGDFDGDGMATVLDFVAFQAAFDEMHPNADCNADGAFNILDFTCFQAAFDSCP